MNRGEFGKTYNIDKKNKNEEEIKEVQDDNLCCESLNSEKSNKGHTFHKKVFRNIENDIKNHCCKKEHNYKHDHKENHCCKKEHNYKHDHKENHCCKKETNSKHYRKHRHFH